MTTPEQDDARSPEELREEVEQELEALTEDAADEESARMAEREETGVDEPRDP